ncbi:hypothetical protein ACFL1R_03615 [Candidatus Latescibacterota bacterium]
MVNLLDNNGKSRISMSTGEIASVTGMIINGESENALWSAPSKRRLTWESKKTE